jgi:hypothetical protein
MKDRVITRVVTWGLILVVLFAIDKILDQPKQWIFQILPTSLFRLDKNLWLGLLLTFATSLFSWFLGIVGGYTIGLFVSSTIIDPDRTHPFVRSAHHADRLLDAIYIVPLVLTLSLSYALTMSFILQYRFPRFVVAIAMTAVAGLTLGGYQVYKSIYESVVHAKRESRYLTEGLFFRKEQRQPRLRRFIWHFIRVKELRDCEIASFCQSVPKAFHLSIVAIMILESITPSFYELLIPQSGIAPAWLGGAGRQILTAQQNNEFQIIAGCIWAVLFFDWTVTWLIDWHLRRKWLRHYMEKA